MDITHTNRIIRTDIWREGTWVDLWSVVHMLSGVLVGLFFYFLDIHAVLGIVVALFALSAYELFEIIAKIDEAPTNRVVDVVVGMVGYLPAFFLVTLVVSGTSLILTFALLLILTISMSVVGWRASQKAAVFEKHFRARLASDRVRLTERGNQFRSLYRERRAREANRDRQEKKGWAT